MDSNSLRWALVLTLVLSASARAGDSKAKVTFQDQVSQVFRSRCNSCHNADKQKGGLNLETFAYVKVTDYTKFVEIQEDLLLRIMDIVAANGTGIAVPSQLMYLDRDRRAVVYKERSGADAQHSAEQFRREPS